MGKWRTAFLNNSNFIHEERKQFQLNKGDNIYVDGKFYHINSVSHILSSKLSSILVEPDPEFDIGISVTGVDNEKWKTNIVNFDNDSFESEDIFETNGILKINIGEYIKVDETIYIIDSKSCNIDNKIMSIIVNATS